MKIEEPMRANKLKKTNIPVVGEPIGDWQEVGVVTVDAGMLWLGDPSYVVHGTTPEDVGTDWHDFCDRVFKKMDAAEGGQDVSQFNHDHQNIPGSGVCVTAGLGDGRYPVDVRRTESGKIAEVRVRFLAERE